MPNIIAYKDIVCNGYLVPDLLFNRPTIGYYGPHVYRALFAVEACSHVFYSVSRVTKQAITKRQVATMVREHLGFREISPGKRPKMECLSCRAWTGWMVMFWTGDVWCRWCKVRKLAPLEALCGMLASCYSLEYYNRFRLYQNTLRKVLAKRITKRMTIEELMLLYPAGRFLTLNRGVMRWRRGSRIVHERTAFYRTCAPELVYAYIDTRVAPEAYFRRFVLGKDGV